jgi:hypothetical protein
MSASAQFVSFNLGAFATAFAKLGASESLARVLAKMAEAFYTKEFIGHTDAPSHAIAMAIAEKFNLPNGEHSFQKGQKGPGFTFRIEIDSKLVEIVPRAGTALAFKLQAPLEGSPLPITGVVVSRGADDKLTNAFFSYDFGPDSESWAEFAAKLDVDVSGWKPGTTTPFMAFVMRFVQTLCGWYAERGSFDGMSEADDLCEVALDGLTKLNKVDRYNPVVVTKLVKGETRDKLDAALGYLAGNGKQVMVEAEPASRLEFQETITGLLGLKTE